MAKDNKKSNGLSNLLIIALIACFPQLVKAQANQNQQYLQKVGVLDSLYSEILEESRKFYVQIPAGYNSEKDQKYPVAFILDGEIFLPTVNDVQNYYSGGFTPEMVLVGIANDKSRVRDLTTSAITTNYGMPFIEKNGEAENFRKFMENELIPFIESKYPVTNYRTLIGHSYGGLFTISTLIHQPDLFANYLAIDPSLDWDDQQLLKQTQNSQPVELEGKALFMAMSGQLQMRDPTITIDNLMQDTSDFTLFSRSNVQFSNLLKEKGKGLNSYRKFYPKDIHGTVPLPSMLDGMLALFQWYQMEQTDKFNSPDTPKDELYEIVKYRAKKLETHFGYAVPPYPEELMNMSGYMNLDMEQPDKAKMFFELAAEYYPTSANAFDSLADYYESQNDYANALKAVTKAYALSGSDYHRERMEALGKED